VDEDRVLRQLAALGAKGIDSLAICLLHAYRNPTHEEIVEKAAIAAGFKEVSRSSEVAPQIKIVSRGDTTVADAYLNPVLRVYLERIRRKLPGSQLQLMMSSGGLIEADRFRGKDSILSGPAGGVIGFSKVAQRAGF